MRVKTQTATLAVLGELGRIPLTAKLHIRLLSYWARLISLPESNLLKISYNMLLDLHLLGTKTWCSQIINTLKYYNLQHLWENKDKDQIKKFNFKKHIQTFHQNSIKKDIQDSNILPKLRTYKLFKTDMNPEKYLLISIPKYRISLTQFRTSSHCLEIERGRYHKPKIPANQRFCKYCDLHEIDDEIHFLLNCNHNLKLRLELFRYIQPLMPNIDIEHLKLAKPIELFIFLMTIENLSVLTAIGKFISQSFTNRNL